MNAMVEVETSELIGPALHWAVAQVVGLRVAITPPHYMTGWRVYDEVTGCAFRPSTDWAQGGPLLDDYSVKFGAVCSIDRITGDKRIRAHGYKLEPDGRAIFSRLASGPTILVAACRSIVKASSGDRVMIPAVLATPEAATDAV